MIKYQLQQASSIANYDEPNHVAHGNCYGLRTGRSMLRQAWIEQIGVGED